MKNLSESLEWLKNLERKKPAGFFVPVAAWFIIAFVASFLFRGSVGEFSLWLLVSLGLVWIVWTKTGKAPIQAVVLAALAVVGYAVLFVIEFVVAFFWSFGIALKRR